MNQEQLREAIAQRNADIAHYQINIDNYEAMLAMLPSEWPAGLVAHRDSEPASFLDRWKFEDIQLLSDLQFREKLRRTLMTERLEQRKSKFVLRALQQKLEL
jgi:hypothetical protein